jgi:3-phenylpropionate/cinnamic acid dioxygenase small subunit
MLAPHPETGFVIKRVHAVLQNDLIDQVIDFYHF